MNGLKKCTRDPFFFLDVMRFFLLSHSMCMKSVYVFRLFVRTFHALKVA